MDSVIVRFREHLLSASNTEREVITYVLNHPQEAVKINIHELASRTFVSSSTITRLCKKTGFVNYKEYQRKLACELALKKEQNRTNDFEIHQEDSLETLLQKSFDRSISALEDTRTLLDIRALKDSVELLTKTESITFFGSGASLLVGKDAYLKFSRIKKPCQVCEDQDIQTVLARNMTKNQLAVLISYSGRTRHIVQIAEHLRENSVPSISITGFAESPLTRLVDHNLYVSAAESHFTSGKLASRISQLAVIDTLYLAYIQRTYEISADVLHDTYLSKAGGTDENGKNF